MAIKKSSTVETGASVTDTAAKIPLVLKKKRTLVRKSSSVSKPEPDTTTPLTGETLVRGYVSPEEKEMNEQFFNEELRFNQNIDATRRHELNELLQHPVTDMGSGWESFAGGIFVNGVIKTDEMPEAKSVCLLLQDLRIAYSILVEPLMRGGNIFNTVNIETPWFLVENCPWIENVDDDLENLTSMSELTSKVEGISRLITRLESVDFEGSDIDQAACRAYIHNLGKETLAYWTLSFVEERNLENDLKAAVTIFRIAENARCDSTSFHDLTTRSFYPRMLPVQHAYGVTAKKRFLADLKGHQTALSYMLKNINMNILNASDLLHRLNKNITNLLLAYQEKKAAVKTTA